MRYSLQVRLLLAATLVLLAFVGMVGLSLERAFYEAAREALKRQLQADTLFLLSVADFDKLGDLRIPETLPDARLSVVGSGLYGFVFDIDGTVLWQSPSALGVEIIPMLGLSSGESALLPVRLKDQELMVMYQAFSWDVNAGSRELLFAVAEATDSVRKEVAGFRRTLWVWFAGAVVLLLFAQIGVLRWSLLPLRGIAKDLEAIESGRKHRLNDRYPYELQGLAVNINALLESERGHLERYRHSLADLAHSLKTPLAILHGCGEDAGVDPEIRNVLQEQLARMDQIVEYQLQRAAARGHKTFSSTVDVKALIEKVMASLNKVYAGKSLNTQLDCDKPERFLCEEGDLYEIAGNLLDNAYKYCDTSVYVTIQFTVEEGKRRPTCRLVVEDDGPGIPAEQLPAVLKRGVRVDQRRAGHGIGLAVVHELVRLAGGQMHASVSRFGGLRWDVVLPSPI